MSNVKNPDHYNYGNFDAWDVMIATLGVEKVIDFCEASAMKYMLRHMMKGGDEDLAKCSEMIDKYFELKASSSDIRLDRNTSDDEKDAVDYYFDAINRGFGGLTYLDYAISGLKQKHSEKYGTATSNEDDLEKKVEDQLNEYFGVGKCTGIWCTPNEKEKSDLEMWLDEKFHIL